MKKIISLLVVIAILIACMAITAFAAADPVEVTVSSATAKQGDKVTISVSVSEATFTTYMIALDYDNTALELVSMAAGERNTGMFMNNKGVASNLDFQDSTGSGVLFTATFNVLAASGNHTVSVVVDNITMADTTQLPTTVKAGTVSISHDHVWDAGEVTTDPGCETAGVKTYTCTACGETKTESVSAIGHKYETAVTAATCTEGGYTTYTCSACGDTYVADKTAALGHDYVAKVTKEATCAAEGVKTYTCSRCNDSYSEAIAKTTTHTPSTDSVITKEPTCEEEGEMTGKCAVCDADLEKQPIAALGHDYELTATVDPTCEVAGSKTYTCKNDASHTKTEEIAALGHNYELTATVEPTCEVDGSELYTCKNDASHTKTEVLPATGHTYETYKQTENGHIGTCACGAVAEEEEHEYSINGDVLVKPTTTTEGEQEKLCVCGAKTVVSIPKEDAKLDDVPKTGDITGELAMGAMVIVAMCAAVAFVFKRKAAK